MKRFLALVFTALFILGALTSVAYARDIKRIDGSVYANQWTTTGYMYKYNAHSDPAIVFIESLTGSLTANMFNTASQSCLGDQAFSSRERRACAWQDEHGHPGYRYFAGIIAPAYREVTSSFSPDSY